MSRSTVFAAVAALAASAGCGGDDGRVSVSGAVRFDGKPLRSGTIFFDPDPTKSNDGPQGIARIVDGKYDTESEGSRLASRGPMVVRISGQGEPTKASPGGEPLFESYRTTADLPPGKPLVIDFDVPASARKEFPASLVKP